MSVQIATEDEFHALRDDWNDLLSRSASDNFFLRWEWIHTWWEIFRQERVLLVLTVRKAGRLVGIAPFYVEPASLLGERRLRFCSDELNPDYMDVIVEKGLERPVVRDVISFIIGRAAVWDVIALDNLLANSILLANLNREDLPYQQGDSLACPYLAIKGTVEEHLKARPPLREFKIEKKLRKLFQKETVRYVLVGDLESFKKGLDDLFFLHKLRKDHVGLRTNFASLDVQRFHHKLGALCLKSGQVELRLLYDGGIPVDAHYSFRYGNKLFQYQQGLNMAYKNFSVGAIALYLELREAFANGLSEYDMLKGDERYKFLWTDTVRCQYWLKAYAPTPRGSFCRAKDNLSAGLRRVKAALRKTPAAPSPPV